MKTLEEMNLTEEDLFKEKSLPYWDQLEQYQFIQYLARSIRDEMAIIRPLVNDIAKDTQIADLSLEALSHKYTVRQICDEILQRGEKIDEMLRFARYYSKTFEFPDES